MLQDDHSSPVLEWLGRAGEGFNVETVRRPDDGDWTAAVLTAIERPGAAPWRWCRSRRCTGRMAGWSTSTACCALRPRRRVVVDATHGAGVIDLDVRRLDPDFLVFPTYKWVLGPYGARVPYVAKRWQTACRFERTVGSPLHGLVQFALSARHGLCGEARRYDMGERDFYISLEMAAIGMEMVAEWGTEAIIDGSGC